MIRKVRISNYKSIGDLTLDLGRVTVLIGANGCGKSNILEAIALGSAAAQRKLDNEFLASRGIRTTDPHLMFSGFDADSQPEDSIRITAHGDGNTVFICELEVAEYSTHSELVEPTDPQRTLATLERLAEWLRGRPRSNQESEAEFQESYRNQLELLDQRQAGPLLRFLIYSPENSALRTFEAEGQIRPLGIRGEGLFAHLKALNTEAHKGRLDEIKAQLSLIDWFEDFAIPEDLYPGERNLSIRDRYLQTGFAFDQRSANEGFLFLLFYITLLVSPDAPTFFSIDNIDSSLNPKLCIALLKQVTLLAKKYDKQVILTTHNPAVLDGLDLRDPEQRLLVVERTTKGHTRVSQVEAPKPPPGQLPVSLSEAFMKGYIGGLPTSF